MLSRVPAVRSLATSSPSAEKSLPSSPACWCWRCRSLHTMGVKGIRVSLFLFGTAGRECLLGGGETTHCTLGLSSTIKHRIAIITVTQHVKHNKNVQSIPNLQWAFSVRTPLRNYFSGWSTWFDCLSKIQTSWKQTKYKKMQLGVVYLNKHNSMSFQNHSKV